MNADFPNPSKRQPLRTQTDEASALPAFDGFPYIATRLVSCLYHVILLPRLYEPALLRHVAEVQVGANRLETCLIIGKDNCVYYSPDGRGSHGSQIPRGGFVVYGKLNVSVPLEEDDELRSRAKLLAAYEQHHRVAGHLFGDLTKGGRDASQEELLRLGRRQPNGIPAGLTQCFTCGDWKGECLDPSPTFKEKVMRVHCTCENQNRCAACGEPLHSHKLNANYLDKTDGQIWHVPGFSALSHGCGGAV